MMDTTRIARTRRLVRIHTNMLCRELGPGGCNFVLLACQVGRQEPEASQATCSVHADKEFCRLIQLLVLHVLAHEFA